MMIFAEFFAGVGLVREGLASDGWSCAWANDIAQDKRETYAANFGSGDFVLDDIWNIAKQPEQIPDNVFLYTASFPCTDLSVAGDRAGLAGEESGTLRALLHILAQKKQSHTQPGVVLLENVKGFLTSHKGKDIRNTVKTLNALGYTVDIIELDAVAFTPQSRPRVFVIAVDNTLAIQVMRIKDKRNILDTWWSHFHQSPQLRSAKLRDLIQTNPDLNWGLFDIPTPEKTLLRLHNIVEDIPEDSPLWWGSEKQQYLFNQMSTGHQAIIREKIHEPGDFYGTVYRRMRNGQSMAELRSDGIAGCLRTPRGGSSKQILVRAGQGNWKARLMTPREYARLQGVRDNFWMPENDNKGFFAMGDAVCVPVIQYLSRHVLKPTYEVWQHTQQTYNKQRTA
ncbi:DNA (cytosine-5)-methyltransferase 1 [Thiothrix caldifontis]|uniref:DNA (cytosine-5-)-methyltransferase n=1 Tax=Thiothrix caldifontis TaxID=525918 RepID=A0A1H4GTB0_9GAMM|nr:DNA (cytosine-5-)-methyltransferase [Thiothrix caldifontis]SEB11872.1 DNA (cytosine-5)-methyltransferase 1 [Thiothrix caldifontis]